jgi:hypothetical protein
MLTYQVSPINRCQDDIGMCRHVMLGQGLLGLITTLSASQLFVSRNNQEALHIYGLTVCDVDSP